MTNAIYILLNVIMSQLQVKDIKSYEDTNSDNNII